MPEHTASLYTGLIAALHQRLTAPDFLERHRQSVKAFTRQRCLPFATVVLFLLNLVKRSLQDELDQFFNLTSAPVVAEPQVTKSAFSQARQKLKAEAFRELNTVQVDYFYAHFQLGHMSAALYFLVFLVEQLRMEFAGDFDIF